MIKRDRFFIPLEKEKKKKKDSSSFFENRRIKVSSHETPRQLVHSFNKQR